MSSEETDRRVIATTADGHQLEARTQVVGRAPDGSFVSVDDVLAELRGTSGYGADGYGAAGYGN